MSILVLYGFMEQGVNFCDGLFSKYKSEFPLREKAQRGIIFKKLENSINKKDYSQVDTFTSEDIHIHKEQDREIKTLMKNYSPQAVVFLYPSTGIQDRDIFETENSYLTIVNSQVNDEFANLVKQRYHGKGFSVERNGHETHHRMPLTVSYANQKEIPLIANGILLYGEDCVYPDDKLNDESVQNQLNMLRGLELMVLNDRFRFLQQD